jgi:hypothetical protein
MGRLLGIMAGTYPRFVALLLSCLLTRHLPAPTNADHGDNEAAQLLVLTAEKMTRGSRHSGLGRWPPIPISGPSSSRERWRLVGRGKTERLKHCILYKTNNYINS